MTMVTIMSREHPYPHIKLQVSQQMALSVRNIPQYQHKGNVAWKCTWCNTINLDPFFTQGELKHVEVRGLLTCACCAKSSNIHATKVQL